ncbi:MAG: twin-arginine translocation signal domain-containing protein [Candidatus Solibacter sp.]|nr:twin-arginine translocation signal domain-containing protein [Candidatus Solibacter sp.]
MSETTRRSLLQAATLAAATAAPLPADTWEGTPSLALSNDRLKMTVLLRGATVADLVLADDTEKLSPLWNPVRMNSELGREAQPSSSVGHFVCVDGFGGVSPEERAAGLPNHGEAHLQEFRSQSRKQGAVSELTLTATLPVMQENFTRTFQVVDGENVVYVESTLENLLGFDRPVQWAEHVTVGSPFLESGVTVFDLSGVRSQTRPYQQSTNSAGTMRRLVSGQDFQRPLAPVLDGRKVDMRTTPAAPNYLDHTATLLDPSREFGWTTALNLKRRLLLGYVFRRAEYPWLQTWGNYPSTGKLARGMEFSTQPYDLPRRETAANGPMFDTPTFRWLPAKSKIQTRFLFFYAPVPAGARLQVALPASLRI